MQKKKKEEHQAKADGWHSKRGVRGFDRVHVKGEWEETKRRECWVLCVGEGPMEE